MLKKSVVTLIFIILFPLSAYASDPWTRNEIIKQGGYALISIIDAAQTKKITHSIGHREANPYLREHSSNKEINEYFLSLFITQTLIANFLSTENRKIFQDVSLIIGATNAGRNYMLGTRINF